VHKRQPFSIYFFVFFSQPELSQRGGKYPQTIGVCAGESLKSQVKSCREILNQGTGGADKGKEGVA